MPMMMAMTMEKPCAKLVGSANMSTLLQGGQAEASTEWGLGEGRAVKRSRAAEEVRPQHIVNNIVNRRLLALCASCAQRSNSV
jgi:hypothetical protein